MTGGVDRAEQINRDEALVAEELGNDRQFRSQRPLLSKGITSGYMVRDIAPNALVLGNNCSGHRNTDRCTGRLGTAEWF